MRGKRLKKILQDDKKVSFIYAMIEIGQTIITHSLRSGANELRSKGSTETRKI